MPATLRAQDAAAAPAVAEPPRRNGLSSVLGRLTQHVGACFSGGPAPLQDENPARPKKGKLEWSNERKSSGYVRQTPDGPVFEIASARRDSVLSERGRKQPAGFHRAGPWRLPVAAAPDDPRGRKFVPRLPTVLTDRDFDERGHLLVGRNFWSSQWGATATRLDGERLTSVGPEGLEELALAAGGASEKGISDIGDAAVLHLFSRSLGAIASQCTDPQAVKNLAHALSVEDSSLHLMNMDLLAVHGTVSPTAQVAQSSFDAPTFRERLVRLESGQHSYIAVGQRYMLCTESGEVKRESGHALSIGIQKQLDGKFRVSVINPNGWPKGKLSFDPSHSVFSDHPAVFKTVTLNDAATAMQNLLENRSPQRPEGPGESEWASPDMGQPLLAWLENMGPAGSRLSADYRGDGQPLVSAHQKGHDCAIESLFAFMATALQPADYKLAKAACLNTLVQVIDRLEPLAAAVPGSLPAKPAKTTGRAPATPLPAARSRLQERITSSLSGAMVAPAGTPPHEGASRHGALRPPSG